MSRSIDDARRVDAHHAAVARGRAQLALLEKVFTHFADGLSARASGERLALHPVTVKRLRGQLHLGRWDKAVRR